MLVNKAALRAKLLRQCKNECGLSMTGRNKTWQFAFENCKLMLNKQFRLGKANNFRRLHGAINGSAVN